MRAGNRNRLSGSRAWPDEGGVPSYPGTASLPGCVMIVKLLVVQGRPAGKQLYFGPGEYYLGRGPECQVRFNTDWVSRQHCLLRVDRQCARLRDLSRNGTLVNGALINGDRQLEHGDQVQIGPVTFAV